MFDEINEVLDTKVRPVLAGHYGDIKLISVEDGIVQVKLLGQCNGCPSATLTVEHVVEHALKETIPSIKTVKIKNEVNDELWEAAKRILKSRNGK
ncbi:NifU family protein [Clostridium sp.]|uniref:NifU family protein n=1 Tax=Clostridium sp. TaxID=1506 RepID=UPI002FC8DD2F